MRFVRPIREVNQLVPVVLIVATISQLLPLR